jgi:aspartyl-tRNA(Asn)/glutamyl-tRNA(Gln) amidotransferase subunit A
VKLGCHQTNLRSFDKLRMSGLNKLRMSGDTFQAHRLDAMVWPTLPMTTVPLDKLAAARDDGKAGTPILAMIHHTFSANITGQPALSVPCGLSESGLPVGFQLLGRPFAEGTLFRIARAYERAHAWSSLSPPMTAYALAD